MDTILNIALILMTLLYLLMKLCMMETAKKMSHRIQKSLPPRVSRMDLPFCSSLILDGMLGDSLRL